MKYERERKRERERELLCEMKIVGVGSNYVAIFGLGSQLICI